jgi:hypothetical protein
MRGRRKLRLEVDPEKLKAIEVYAQHADLLEIDRIKLAAIAKAATGNFTYRSLSKTLKCATSAVQKWIQRWHEVDADVEEFLRVRRYRTSPFRNKKFKEKLQKAFKIDGINTGHKAAHWARKNFGIVASPQRMNYWLDRIEH